LSTVLAEKETHYKLTNFYLSIGKVSFVRLINLPPGSSICLTNRTLQINRQMPNIPLNEDYL
jgi:hypothetical protein